MTVSQHVMVCYAFRQFESDEGLEVGVGASCVVPLITRRKDGRDPAMGGAGGARTEACVRKPLRAEGGDRNPSFRTRHVKSFTQL